MENLPYVLVLLIFAAFLYWLNRKPPVDDVTVFHKCKSPFLPKRTVDGGWTEDTGQTWQRWNGTAWEYKQDEETAKEQVGRSAP